MDETASLRANRTRHTQFVSGLVDTASGRLLDVVADRTALGSHALAGPAANGAGSPRIGVVALDSHRGYARAVATHLAHATLVVDHFHLIRLANQVIDDVRRRVQQQTTGHRGGKHDPLSGIRILERRKHPSVLGAQRLDLGLLRRGDLDWARTRLEAPSSAPNHRAVVG